MNDIIVGKIKSIHLCIKRAREEYQANPGEFKNDYSRQDAAILNIIRGCEQAIDLANHILKTYTNGDSVIQLGILCTACKWKDY